MIELKNLSDNKIKSNLGLDKPKILAIQLKDIFETVKKDVAFNEILNLKYSQTSIEYLNLIIEHNHIKVCILNNTNLSKETVLTGLSELGFVSNNINLVLLSTSNIFNILNKNSLILAKSSIDKRLDSQTYLLPTNSDFDIFHYQNVSRLLKGQ